MKILGINALNHDAAVAMIQDGEVLFAGHSERYSGVKNDSDLNDELIAQHLNVPLSKKKTDGPYGPSKPYIKIGIYRIGETGTTSFAYNNLIIKNKKK